MFGMDGQTYGRTDGHFQSTSGPLSLHFRLPVTSSPLIVIVYQKKMNFAKFVDGHTEKKVTSKDSFR